MSFEWLYSGTDMSIRDYFASAIAKREPGVTFDDCNHDLTADELAEVVNASSVSLFRFKNDDWVYKRNVWSPDRVYFIIDDGRQQVRSRPRNPD